MEVRVGQHIGGHRLLHKIAEGHFGQVWRAHYMGQTVALKIFTRVQKVNRESLKREAFAQYSLGHLPEPEGRFFPRIEHVNVEATPPWMRMELIAGRPLEEVLADGELSLRERLNLGMHLLTALSIVHQQDFIHGDLSPANVLVTEESIKLVDVGFGAVFDDESPDVTVSNTAQERSLGVASPLYAAPERFDAEFLKGCGKPSDVFAFGKVLYQLITGESPFVVKPVSRKFKVLGAPWDEFLYRCLEERRENRFPDAVVALEEYRKIYQPQAAEGEFRAECPECRHGTRIPGGWAGERFPCPGCRMMLEVLFYDEENDYATTTVVVELQDDQDAAIQFVEGDDPAVRIFCPACGDEVKANQEQCPGCHVAVNETAKQIVLAQTRKMRAKKFSSQVRRESFVGPAGMVFFSYFLLWIPGALLNFYYLEEAKKVERVTGKEPPGLMALLFMMWAFAFLPLVGMALLFVMGVFLGFVGILFG